MWLEAGQIPADILVSNWDGHASCLMKFLLDPACASFSPDNVTVPDDAELAAFFKNRHEVNPKAATFYKLYQDIATALTLPPSHHCCLP